MKVGCSFNWEKAPRRLHVQNPTLSAIDDVKLPGQSVYEWLIHDNIAPFSGQSWTLCSVKSEHFSPWGERESVLREGVLGCNSTSRKRFVNRGEPVLFWRRWQEGVLQVLVELCDSSRDTTPDDCFDYHSWRNNVVIAFGTLSSFLT